MALVEVQLGPRAEERPRATGQVIGSTGTHHLTGLSTSSKRGAQQHVLASHLAPTDPVLATRLPLRSELLIQMFRGVMSGCLIVPKDVAATRVIPLCMPCRLPLGQEGEGKVGEHSNGGDDVDEAGSEVLHKLAQNHAVEIPRPHQALLECHGCYGCATRSPSVQFCFLDKALGDSVGKGFAKLAGGHVQSQGQQDVTPHCGQPPSEAMLEGRIMAFQPVAVTPFVDPRLPSHVYLPFSSFKHLFKKELYTCVYMYMYIHVCVCVRVCIRQVARRTSAPWSSAGRVPPASGRSGLPVLPGDGSRALLFSDGCFYKLGSLFVGALIIRSLKIIGSTFWPPDFWKLPHRDSE